jgi:hypothetical protein
MRSRKRGRNKNILGPEPTHELIKDTELKMVCGGQEEEGQVLTGLGQNLVDMQGVTQLLNLVDSSGRL